MSDPVADYLTRIRNAQMAKKLWVDIPTSILKLRISYILKEEHFIRDYILIKDDIQGILRIFLNYDYNGDPVIKGIKRISKPGCRHRILLCSNPNNWDRISIWTVWIRLFWDICSLNMCKRCCSRTRFNQSYSRNLWKKRMVFSHSNYYWLSNRNLWYSRERPLRCWC